MKTFLLAGGAAVALCAFSGVASAQTKFNVMVGGDAYFEAGYVDEDGDANLRNTEFRNRFRINFIPSAKADNGLEYGGRIRIRANNGNRTTDFDLAYMFVQGAFGTVQMGTNYGLSDADAIIGPVDWGTFGGPDGDFTAFTNNAVTSAYTYGLRTFGSSNPETRITYYTPSFSGLKAGVSYTPRLGGSGSQSVAGNIDRNDTTAYNDAYEIGLIYGGEFSGVTVDATAFYSGATAGANNVEDVSSYQFGANIGYAGFKLGGSYSNHTESGYAKTAAFKDDQEFWMVAGQYTTGPLTLGVAYSESTDAGSATVRGDRSFDTITAGLTYVVAPGLSVGAEYTHYSLETNEAGVTDIDGDVLILTTRLTF